MERVKKTITKTELSQTISAEMNAVLKERNITQAQLVKKMQEAGYSVLQSDASKILADKAKVNIYFLSAFSEVLGISLDELVYGRHSTALLQLGGKNFQIDPAECDGFHNILGEYYVYFYSTNRTESSQLISGRLLLQNKEGFCEAVMVLERAGSRRLLKKTYSGQMVLSRKMNSGYVVLSNENYGELSMFAFRYRDFLTRPMECRLAMAVTISAGDSKKPTAHRLLLTRRKLEEKEQTAFISSLNIESKDIIIEEEALVRYMENNPQQTLIEKLVRETDHRGYLVIRDEDIRRAKRKISNRELVQTRKLLGELSEEQLPNAQISEEDDAEIFALLSHLFSEE